MDIGNIFEEWDFSGSVPLPYRVLLMGCIGIFAWASNLHILAHLRVDVSNLLFSSPPLSGNYPGHPRHHGFRENKYFKSSPLAILYRSIYTLGLAFLAMVLINMWMYKWVVAGSLSDSTSDARAKSTAAATGDSRGGMGMTGNPRTGIMVPILGYLTVVAMIFIPFNVLFKKDRYRFLRSMKKALFSGFKSEVTFADVILADILTSFARVFGDLAVALCLMFLDRDGSRTDACYGSILVPIMTSIPYCIRLRQCLSEWIESNYVTERHLMNALKYASAFPVIIVSSMQKSAKSASLKGVPYDGYMSDNTLFRLWLFFVAINSFYSFYWDIYHDWNLIQPQTQSRAGSLMINTTIANSAMASGSSGPHNRSSGAFSPTTPKSGSLSLNDGNNNSSSGANTLNSSSAPLIVNLGSEKKMQQQQDTKQRLRYGMRSYLHYEDKFFYIMAVVLDFLLRTTWMLKLVSNIQIEEYEGGVFTMECLEVLRRWIWVLFRLESEMVKRNGYTDAPTTLLMETMGGGGVGGSGSGSNSNHSNLVGGNNSAMGDSDIDMSEIRHADSTNVMIENLETWQQKVN
ncbi:hypothetical protein EMPS_05264 [Entomortierella parvispora]|uniref:EXS domain-containing protein n=1 Tax=Entomortierella parvispora TaxID=205924 RepID=A0A9P3HA00_9FUNG|nr:hypothetical protein EMPS_05264 [Entomortierella parvispora]